MLQAPVAYYVHVRDTVLRCTDTIYCDELRWIRASGPEL